MKLLIDTQSIIWFAENDSALSAKARSMMEDADNECMVSMASYWEMAIKISLGKLSINSSTL